MTAGERDIHGLIEKQIKGKVFVEREDGSKVEIGEMIPIRRGFGTRKGRPDTLVWLKLSLPLLGTIVRGKYPILVEAGKAGMADARVDFLSFCQTDEIEIPGLVIGGSKREDKELPCEPRFKVNVTLIPSDRIWG